ncbi:hypothetical protein F4778DRAFT_522866 [Xylariomycetidae sp. FL2044]|nr:hypothetical protein F4778DRAFT_522866 [Xylariomycetidae sp. FL2044]
MELTPIAIPGKRRRKGAMPVISMPKRPKERSKTKPKRPRAPKASYMEKELPLEVLERIFWFSENVNFPRSSHRIGRLLSGGPTLRETFIHAFAPTWDVWYGCIRTGRTGGPIVQSYFGWDQDSARFGGNPDFQSDLLEFPWTNVSFILQCWELWARRNARDRFYPYPEARNPPAPGSFESSAICPSHAGEVSGPSEIFLHDYNLCLQSLDVADYTEILQCVNLIEVHRDTRIPDRLLTGPWDEEAVQKLFWLVRAGARLSPEQTWEVTLQGFWNAIREDEDDGPTQNRSRLIIKILDILSASKTWPEHLIDEYAAPAHSEPGSHSRFLEIAYEHICKVRRL